MERETEMNSLVELMRRRPGWQEGIEVGGLEGRIPNDGMIVGRGANLGVVCCVACDVRARHAAGETMLEHHGGVHRGRVNIDRAGGCACPCRGIGEHGRLVSFGGFRPNSDFIGDGAYLAGSIRSVGVGVGGSCGLEDDERVAGAFPQSGVPGTLEHIADLLAAANAECLGTVTPTTKVDHRSCSCIPYQGMRRGRGGAVASEGTCISNDLRAVCCKGACTDDCKSCALPGSEGMCAARPADELSSSRQCTCSRSTSSRWSASHSRFNRPCPTSSTP